MTSLYVHLLDQLQWSLISPSDALPAAGKLLNGMGMDIDTADFPESASPVDLLTDLYKTGFMRYLKQRGSI